MGLSLGQDCNSPGEDPNAMRIDLDAGIYMYSCNSGYSTGPGGSGSASITLSCDNGNWSPVQPPSNGGTLCYSDSDVPTSSESNETTELTEQSCQDPGLVENSDRYFDHFDHGGKVYFNCKPDFCAQHELTRTIEAECINGSWNKNIEKIRCLPCNYCAVPNADILHQKHISMTLHPDFTATVTCDDEYVITPGTDIKEGTVECIENGKWAPELPTCSKRPQVICGSDQISVIINKNMLDSLGFTGGVNSLAMTGLNANTEIIMKGCKAELDDEGDNYTFNIQSPYTGKCMTHFSHVNQDGLGNEANLYNFRNKIVWRQNSGAVMRSSTILDWTCEYNGLFVTGLDGPIKLALSTRTYVDTRRGYNLQEFTVSMGMYAFANYTNLLDSKQVVHKGKRYYVALWLHEEEKGTPFLDYCYGSPSEKSQAELIAEGRTPEPQDQIRSYIEDGCPVSGTLAKLEIPGSTADRRFSFMYPHVFIDSYQVNYMYIHCEIKLRPTGFKPSCSRQNQAVAGSGLGGVVDETGTKLGKSQFYQRTYGGGNNRNNMRDFFQQRGFNNIISDSNPNAALEKNQRAMDAFANGPVITGKSSNGGFGGVQFEGFTGRRKRRAAGDASDYTVSLGPMVLARDEDVNPEDIKEVVMKTKVPLKANKDGTVSVDEEAPQQDMYEFKFNTTYTSRDQDIDMYKRLLPQDRYVDKFEEHPGKIEWSSEAIKSDMGSDLDRINAAVDNIIAEDIAEEVAELEEEQKENFAMKAICIIAGFLVGGAILFGITLYIAMNADCLTGSNSANNSKNKAANSQNPRKGKTNAVMTVSKQNDEKELNNSCGSSLTSAE